MGRVSLELYREFYTDGGFVEDPFGSGYYTLGNAVETPEDSGLYGTDTVIESPISGLYNIPDSGRRKTTANIEQYTVQEDATTIDPSNFFGGSGQITVGMQDFEDSTEFLTANATLTDSENGRTVGKVRDLNSSFPGVAMTADSILGLLNADHFVAPQVTTFANAMQAYFSTVNLGNSLFIEAALRNRSVSYPGWFGNLWDHLKQIFVAERVEVALVDGVIHIRNLRGIRLSTDNFTATGWTLNNQNTAKKVRIHYYNNTLRTQAEVYPVPAPFVMPRDREDAPAASEPQIYNVDAGERLVFTVQLSASLLSVNQPTVVDFVANRDYSNTNGVYAVSGNDGKPITAAQWSAQGGSLSARILPEDPSQIEVTIIGASDDTYAPYRIAMTAGTGSYYNSLHITGRGVFFEDRYVDLTTGTTAAVTGEEIGAEVTNPFISSLTQAYNVGQRTAANYALQYKINGVGRKFVESANFGRLVGGRIGVRNAQFRVDSTTQSVDTASLEASLDTIVADFNAAIPAGTTAGEFSARWLGRTSLDFSVAPLKE